MDLEKLLDCMTDNEKERLRELIFEEDKGKTDIYLFIANNELTHNLRNALIDIRKYYCRYVEDIKKREFLKFKGVSLKSWEKIQQLRG